MNIKRYVDMVYDKISSFSDEYRCIKAYPNTYKPTRMKNVTVVVSPVGEATKAVGLGAYAKNIETTVDITVFCPYDQGLDKLNRIVDIVSDSGIFDESISFSIGMANASKLLDTISVSITVGYNDFVGE